MATSVALSPLPDVCTNPCDSSLAYIRYSLNGEKRCKPTSNLNLRKYMKETIRKCLLTVGIFMLVQGVMADTVKETKADELSLYQRLEQQIIIDAVAAINRAEADLWSKQDIAVNILLEASRLGIPFHESSIDECIKIKEIGGDLNDHFEMHNGISYAYVNAGDVANAELFLRTKKAQFFELLKEYKLDMRKTDSTGQTILHNILQKHYPSKLFLSANCGSLVDSETYPFLKLMPLIVSLMRELYSENDVQNVLNAKDAMGYTPLMVATLVCGLQQVNYLIEVGANLMITNKEGETALMLAERAYNYWKEHGTEDMTLLSTGDPVNGSAHTYLKIINILKQAETNWTAKHPEQASEYSHSEVK